MRSLSLLVCALSLAACQVALPKATAAPGHGLQRVWIETLGLE